MRTKLKLLNFENVIGKLNNLKTKSRTLSTNLIDDVSTLREKIDKKKSLCYEDENSIILLVPYHDRYYDLTFISVDVDSLKKSLEKFLHIYEDNLTLRILFFGKESPYTEKLLSIFSDCGFELGKQQARTRLRSPQKKEEKGDVEKRLSLIDTFDGFTISLANEGDEQEVLALLLEEFDYCVDNIPELEDIAENIRKGQVIVTKNEKGELVACHYFEIKNSIYYGLYDVVKKEFRKYLLDFNIAKFRSQYIAHYPTPINRVCGWRDISNKRLMRYAIRNNQIPDGLYMYSILYNLNRDKAMR